MSLQPVISEIAKVAISLLFNPLASEFKIPAEPNNAGDKMAPPR